MASSEQLLLSNYIKNVHINLRNNSKKLGFESAWHDHCQNDKILQEYAVSMKKLATEYWDENAKNDDKVISRIAWVYENCQKYFEEEMIRQRKREIDVLNKLENVSVDIIFTTCKKCERLKVLDVGSCYNPFKIYDNFDVTPIDIAPSCEDVYKCDFLNVEIGTDNVFEERTVVSLKRQFFNVIVFSLLLEYIPSAEKRLQCCKNAYSLLDFEGLLIIITPDSKHVGANAKYMKSWRYALSLVGFSRIKYEKLPYLHCIIFRKAISSEFSKRWATMHENDGLDDVIYIPQDFQDCVE